MKNADAPFEPLYDVAIIGAGFSGSLTAIHLLEEAGGGRPAASVVLIERELSAFGKGVAYGTPCSRHLLNVPAGKMGAFPDRIDDFLLWLEAHPAERAALGSPEIDAGKFVPRMLYGQYISSLLAEAADRADGRLRRMGGEAVDIAPAEGGSGPLRIELADGRRVRAERVVLALGTFPPGDPRLRDARFHRSPRYLYSPWSAETHERLAGPGDALILGSGLTALDLLLTLKNRKRSGVLHVLSRRGLFPQPHRAGVAPWPAFLRPGELPRTVRKLLRLIRAELSAAEAAGMDWRAVIDSLRPFTQEFWRGLSNAERCRFLRHLRPLWESHRHRAAPEALAVKEEMERSGRLVCHRGRVERITEADGGSALDVSFQPRGGEGERAALRVDYVVNCTGPECNYHRLEDPLIQSLFARGLARPDALMLGLDVEPGGGVLDVHGVVRGRLFTLGSPQKGLLMETTAVPELRAQARDLASRLRRQKPDESTAPAPSGTPPALAPRHELIFEI
jgi:uncharacterized NAD(P)/FAD-binding protein YdhS